MAPRAVIFGLSGPAPTGWERAFFAAADPWGFILFERNVVGPEQVRRLVAELRETVGREAPVLIDQEGGRVARLGPPHWRAWPPVADLFVGRDEVTALEALWLRYRLIAAELARLGIDVDCAPVLDVPAPGGHEVIGDRALGRDAESVARRGRVVASALKGGGVLPVIKHIPGHGRAGADSHEELPRVSASAEELRAVDFAPFRALAGEALGMTAHVVYEALDAERPATLSPVVIRAIREEIGFDGLLMTDDLEMGALSGPVAERAAGAIAAGCDVVLHCSGDLAAMEAVAGAVPELADEALKRAERAEAARSAPNEIDLVAVEARYRELTGEGVDA